MNLLDQLNALNGVAPAPKPVQPQVPAITFVLTSCGRLDLLEKTMDSFFRHNQHPIERYLIVEDSANEAVFQQCKALNATRYDGKLEFIFNHQKKGQAASIDAAYATVTTPYIFHCEEDWEFYRPGFIQQSVKVLEADETILQAWIRPKSDGILNNINPEVEVINGVAVRRVLPTALIIKGAGERGGPLTVAGYMGFSWNPGLKRLSDYKLLKGGYSASIHEHTIDSVYRAHSKGFSVVSISIDDSEGFVKRSGLSKQSNASVAAPKPATEEFKVKLPTISVVMQAYLADYPGSRVNAVEKFHRAIESFLAQEYKRAELVIVSDGCKIVHTEILRYANTPAIKYVYADKAAEANMYELKDGQRFFRGVARQLGVDAAIGELVTYMDSDDLLTKKFLYNIVYTYNLAHTVDWWINSTWYDHTIMAQLPLEKILQDYDGIIHRFDGIDADFIQSRMKPGMLNLTPWLLTHRRECTTKWQDSVEVTEDVNFSRRLRAAYPKGHMYSTAGYARCHYSGLWDV